MFLSGLLTLWATTFTLSGHYVAFALQDVSKDLFGSENHGTVAAFGDFNSDKQTDIFILRGQTELLIFLADLKAPYFKPKVHLTKDAFPRDISVITSVVPADYDGDSQMDVLLTGHLKNSDPGQNSVFIFWGNNQTLDQSGRVDLNNTFQDQPLVMDFNGDMVPDIFGVVDGAPEICYLRNRKLRCEKALSSGVTIRVPHSNAFIDLNKDFTADLFLSTQSNSGLEFETWINTDGNFTRNHSVGVPEDSSVVGQSAFVDFDGDGSQDHLLPMCLDSVCKKSAIYLAKPGHTEWAPVLLDFQNRDTLWGFVSPPHNPSEGELELPITLHLGDYNLDGFPDALAILCNTSHREQAQAFLLENVPCTNASCRSVGRMFRVHWDQSDLSAIPRAAVATFFDIYEDGILDMIVLSRADGQQDFKIHALKNNFEADAYFVKVIVLSGICSNDCPEKVKPFGVNQPGPYVMYMSVDSNGYLKNASAGQLSQSAHLSLQLPYTVLGLGRSANFLDHLFVGIPRPLGVKDMRKQEWTAIIPNSQLIVIPYPNSDPRSWSAKLYLTPSNIVLLTAVALIGVCLFILVIIGVLHWQEKKADDREKRQEAHRFHFDAM
ncbi:T-cell immunomodulatory protein isoform X2 [Electrophorus electricus]|uniref:T-cell immunomodulatory protein TIP C2 domain-containing protein n=1 Tax=Electrophorus electricus TaxID=8005 RepID=A0AAY5F043_ELEEL|nr:T-cell immunomodulatory protein isoform X2 [Electrophorus electricus]